MRVLYIGGTGEISFACVTRSAALGHDVTVFNRGNSEEKLPDSVAHIAGDLQKPEPYAALDGNSYDVVCQFLAYDETDVQRDLETFAGRCDQYVFISSAAAYRKPHTGGLVTEDTPLDNPYWTYARRKAACEALLREVSHSLPITIVRPSHTYRRRLPSTVIDGNIWRGG